MNDTALNTRDRREPGLTSFPPGRSGQVGHTSPSEQRGSSALRLPARRAPLRTLPAFRWMARLLVLLIVICLGFGVWVWFQILSLRLP